MVSKTGYWWPFFLVGGLIDTVGESLMCSTSPKDPPHDYYLTEPL